MAFVKTTWTDNALPAITAAQLNRIEQGIDDLYNRGGGQMLSPAVGAWTPLTLLNSWAPLGGTWPVPAYLKDPMGLVHFRGAMQGGAFNDTPAFTMPAGYRVPGDATSGAHLIFATGGGFGVAHFRGTGDFDPFTGSAWIDLTNVRYWPTQ